MEISINQIRMARTLKRWTQDDLAKAAGISRQTVFEIETEKVNPQVSTIRKIREAFENSGIEFLESEGIRKQSARVKIFEGQQGFWNFYDDLYLTIKEHGGEVLVSNVDEREFEKWLGERLQLHRERMYPLKNYDLKIIVREGDKNLLSQYERAEYRWVTKGKFSNLPFYIYGDKLALIDFEPGTVTVFLHDHPKIAKAFRRNFYLLWEQAERLLHG